MLNGDCEEYKSRSVKEGSTVFQLSEYNQNFSLGQRLSFFPMNIHLDSFCELLLYSVYYVHPWGLKFPIEILLLKSLSKKRTLYAGKKHTTSMLSWFMKIKSDYFMWLMLGHDVRPVQCCGCVTIDYLRRMMIHKWGGAVLNCIIKHQDKVQWFM